MAETLSEQVARLEALASERCVKELESRANALSLLLAEERSRLAYWREKYAEMRNERNVAREELAAAESREQQARVEGAREALTRLAEKGRRGEWQETFIPESAYRPYWLEVTEFRDREYPAVPPEREGARRSRQCESCVHHAQAHEGNECRATNCLCDGYRPTPPQAAPEPGPTTFSLRVVRLDDGEMEAVITPADCQRIVETARRASGRDDA